MPEEDAMLAIAPSERLLELDWYHRHAPCFGRVQRAARRFLQAHVRRLFCRSSRDGDEVANAAELLMSDRGTFITGSDFLVDGGTAASYFYGKGVGEISIVPGARGNKVSPFRRHFLTQRIKHASWRLSRE